MLLLSYFHTLLILNSGWEVLKSIREALATQGTCTASAISVDEYNINKSGDKIIHQFTV